MELSKDIDRLIEANRQTARLVAQRALARRELCPEWRELEAARDASLRTFVGASLALIGEPCEEFVLEAWLQEREAGRAWLAAERRVRAAAAAWDALVAPARGRA